MILDVSSCLFVGITCVVVLRFPAAGAREEHARFDR